MSNKSNNLGRAFEYACLIELKNRIIIHRPVEIDEESAEAAFRAWKATSFTEHQTLITAATAFIDTLFEAEPLILETENDKDVIKLSINKDSDAENGDVRDIVISRGIIKWDIGLSMKHNHFAIKHSRLSEKNDFGKKWYGIPCDKSYWNSIIPIFSDLKYAKEINYKWRDITDKESSVYIPLLKAFMNEINRAYEQDKTIPSRLISYLLGTRDFYKVVAIDNRMITELQGFNLRGELNQNGKYSNAKLIIPIAKLPNEIITLRFKPNSSNTIEMFLNNGWSLSFRIHNASTFVEPSLKFDIQFLGVPSNIITINCSWK